jgi:hypothetical protein
VIGRIRGVLCTEEGKSCIDKDGEVRYAAKTSNVGYQMSRSKV